MRQVSDAVTNRNALADAGMIGSKRTGEPRRDTLRMSDETLAATLLTLSADLLRSRYPAVAAMIGYAIADIIERVE